ncbi:MAG TPA: CoA pyrophosphatase [Burkholderiales bacterium]|nr:CoA pyrophosphatase [Burkholderiales bacterium]
MSANILGSNRKWLVNQLARAVVSPQWQGRPEQALFEPIHAIQAAVLVPLINRESGITVLFTQRTAHLADHAGQISFPGGRAEAGDTSAHDTALREAEEEIGLPRSSVDVLGIMPDYFVHTGFRIAPVVGLINPPFPVKLDSFEVEEIFEVPLHYFLDPANHERHSISYMGRPRQYYAMPYQRRFIWGATAGILYNLYQVLSSRSE